MNAFRLSVMAIATIAIIALALNLFGFFVPETDFAGEVNEQLRKAEISLGKLQATSLSISEVGAKASVFETDARNVVFNCNDLRYCCEKSKLEAFKGECEKGIAWNEKTIAVKKSLALDVSSRCYFDVIYWCTVYIGKQPAEISVQLDAEKEIETGKEYFLELNTMNSGETFSVEIQREAYISLVEDSIEGKKKTKLTELALPEIRLAAGDEILEKIPFTVNQPGKIEVNVKAFETVDKTNFAEAIVELNALGETIAENSCKADKSRKNEKEFDLTLDTCVEKFYCVNCVFAADCTEAWEKEGYSNLLDKTASNAIRKLETKIC